MVITQTLFAQTSVLPISRSLLSVTAATIYTIKPCFFLNNVILFLHLSFAHIVFFSCFVLAWYFLFAAFFFFTFFFSTTEVKILF